LGDAKQLLGKNMLEEMPVGNVVDNAFAGSEPGLLKLRECS